MLSRARERTRCASTIIKIACSGRAEEISDPRPRIILMIKPPEQTILRSSGGWASWPSRAILPSPSVPAQSCYGDIWAEITGESRTFPR